MNESITLDKYNDILEELKDLSQKEYEGHLTEKELNRLQDLLAIREIALLNRLYAGFLNEKGLMEEFQTYMESGVVNAFSDLFEVDLRRNKTWH